MIWLQTAVLGLGFLAISAVWPLYDTFMPIFYSQYIGHKGLIGAIMGLDNLFGLTLQPYFGALSDQTRTRLGRRIPYLLVGMPVAAFGLIAIPYARDLGLVPLLAATVLMNLAMASFRAPTVALMPDLVPPHLRSQANGVINFMGGVGAAAGLAAGSALFHRDPHLPFLAVGALMLGVTLAFLAWIRERPAAGAEGGESPARLLAAVRSLAGTRDRELLLLLTAIFLWSFAQQGVQTWFSTWARDAHGLTPALASRYLLYFLGTFVVLAVPAGFVSGRLGRRAGMAVGALLLAAAALALPFGPLGLLVPALLVGGAGYALFVVNAYPATVQLAPLGQVGTYTGLYYIAGPLAATVAPAVTGWVAQLGGWRVMFALAAALFALAAWAVWQVRGADPPAAAARNRSVPRARMAQHSPPARSHKGRVECTAAHKTGGGL